MLDRDIIASPIAQMPPLEMMIAAERDEVPPFQFKFREEMDGLNMMNF